MALVRSEDQAKLAGSLADQLAQLRQRIARLEQRTKLSSSSPTRKQPPQRLRLEEYLGGQEVQTPYGSHFETEKLYPRHRRHGSMDLSDLEELPPDLLGPISAGEIAPAPPTRWAFLDTETTGLAGGTGTYAFLIGVGRITPEGFRVRQFFMRDYSEEASLLHAVAEHLNEFDVLITYNGKIYDLPLLETRYRMARRQPPFHRLAHLDLLFGARRLWRFRYESCRLVELEQQVLGVEREGDLPSELIPYVYFEYLRRREALQLVPVFHHNAMDILSLACLAAIVPQAFRDPTSVVLRHGTELLGLARWLLRQNQPAQAVELFRRAIHAGLPDELLFPALWNLAMLQKRLYGCEAALAVLEELASGPNPYRVPALEELAKYYEHRLADYERALQLTLQALELEPTESLRKRRQRLERRLAKHCSGRLL